VKEIRQQLRKRLLQDKLIDPEFVFVIRADLGLHHLLRELGAKINISEVWRRVADANAAGRRERFPGITGTMIVHVCGAGIAVTGLSECQARREGFDAVSAAINGLSKPGYFHGTPVRVDLVAERRSGRLLGGSVMGQCDAALRIDVIVAALTSRMRLDDFEHLDLAYAPPFAPVWDPLLIAAQQLRKLV
jgi:NADPH-dependent 2,4-dienoyl-CoA reductase/sulfur reductase-like enzyme